MNKSTAVIASEFFVRVLQFALRLETGGAANDLFDFKLVMMPAYFAKLVGHDLNQRLQSAFTIPIPLQQSSRAGDDRSSETRLDSQTECVWTEVILRRVQTSLLSSSSSSESASGNSHGAPSRWIPFHSDEKARTMQVFLNDESEYSGGHVVYLLNNPPSILGSSERHSETCGPGVLYRVGRPAGGAVLHDWTVMHGVTRCSGGMRYSLFLVQKPDAAVTQS